MAVDPEDLSGPPVRGLLASTSSAAAYVDDVFRDVVEHAPYALLVVDPAGRITFANARIQALFGYHPAELQGRPVESLIPHAFPAQHAVLRAQLQREAVTGRDVGGGRDLHGLHRDGREFPVEVGLSAIQTGAGPVVLAAIADITARRAAEKALPRARSGSESSPSTCATCSG
jgi:PAS domain S-box-containing protein